MSSLDLQTFCWIFTGDRQAKEVGALNSVFYLVIIAGIVQCFNVHHTNICIIIIIVIIINS